MSVRVPAGVLALVATTWLLFTFYDRFWYPPDEGNYAHVAQRVLDGEALNLEVQDIHPGYITFLNAAALRAFGVDLISLRYPLVFAGLLQALVLYLHFPRERPWLAALAATALTALGAIQFLNPTAHWYCLALVVILIACLDAARNHRGWLLAVGLLIGTITLFRQLTGVFAGIGALTFLLWHAGERGASGPAAALGRALVLAMVAVLGLYLASSTDISGIVLFGLWPLLLLGRLLIRPQAPNRVAVGIAATISAGVLIAALPLLAYHAWHGSLGAWAGDIGPAAVALTRLDFFDRSNYGALIVQALRQAATGGTWSTVVNGLYWATLPLLAVANGVIVLRLSGRSMTSTSAIAPLPIVAVFYALVSVHFQIPVYLYYSAGLVVASLLFLSTEITGASRLLPALATGLTATAIFFHAGQPASRGIQGILQGNRTPPGPTAQLPHNSLRIDAGEARRYAAILEVICREVPEGGSMFSVPSNAELYFMSQRRNPFRFYNTALGVRDEAALAAVERMLDDRPPKLVTFDPEDKYNTPASLKIMEAVKRRYRFLGRYDPFDVYLLP